MFVKLKCLYITTDVASECTRKLTSNNMLNELYFIGRSLWGGGGGFKPTYVAGPIKSRYISLDFVIERTAEKG